MKTTRTQEDRSQTTRTALLSAARDLFAAKGYSGTGTPEIVAAAGVTRGALYHHFSDKKELFTAVVEAEHQLVALAVNEAAYGPESEPGPIKALTRNAEAFLSAMQDKGRLRILALDAPAVMDREALDAIEARHGLRPLIEGIKAAMAAEALRELPVEPLVRLFAAALYRAALAPKSEADTYRKTVRALIRGLKVR